MSNAATLISAMGERSESNGPGEAYAFLRPRKTTGNLLQVTVVPCRDEKFHQIAHVYVNRRKRITWIVLYIPATRCVHEMRVERTMKLKRVKDEIH